MSRRGYLDWLRGIAVVIMIEAHTLDSWTRLDERNNGVYAWAVIVAGYGAPLFLFLAGVAIVLAAGSRVRRGSTAAEAAARARRRGWQIFGLAFLFRLQSWLISGGPASSLLKADILNIIGLSMLGAAVLWRVGREWRGRAALFAAATVACALLTPVVREMTFFAPLPDRLEGYFRPNRLSTFSLFPWAGFLFAGGLAGVFLDRVMSAREERRVNAAFLVLGGLLVAGAFGAPLVSAVSVSPLLPGSPAFFFLRLGVVLVLLPVAYGWGALWQGYSPLQDLGRWSLFIYWIHVEMVYGVVSSAIHKQLPLPVSLTAFIVFTLCMYALARLAHGGSTTRFLRTARQQLSPR